MGDVGDARGRRRSRRPGAGRIAELLAVCVAVAIGVHGAERGPGRRGGEVGDELVRGASRNRGASPGGHRNVGPEVAVDVDAVLSVRDLRNRKSECCRRRCETDRQQEKEKRRGN